MIDLYTGPTGNARRAAIALAECGLPFRVHKLDVAKGDGQKPEFLKINPAGQIPAIVDPDGPGGKPLVLTQSSAILLYAAEKTGRSMPKDPLRRLVAMQWFMQAITDVAPASSVMFYASQAPNHSKEAAAFYEQRFLKACANADARLAGREYLADEFSIADIALYPVVLARKAVVDAAPGLANLKAWEKRMAARPAVAKALADNG